MATKLSDREMRAWQALLHAHHEVTRLLDADLRREHGLSFERYDVLLRLGRAPDASLRMSDLAERVMAPPSTLTRRVDRLVRDGLVSRDRRPTDSRVVVVRLTEEGRHLLRRAARTHLRGIRQHFTGRLTDRQLDEVAGGLEVIAGEHQPH